MAALWPVRLAPKLMSRPVRSKRVSRLPFGQEKSHSSRITVSFSEKPYS